MLSFAVTQFLLRHGEMTMYIKAIEQYCQVLPFVMLYKLFRRF